MSDKEFEELFEKAPDWPTAVAGLRGITEPGAGLDLLKDTAKETMLAILACHLVEVKSASMSRYVGGEIEISAPPFHVFVFKKAFFCYREELVPGDVLANAERAATEANNATARSWEARKKLPPEMQERWRRNS
jgi:hypothetical protein